VRFPRHLRLLLASPRGVLFPSISSMYDLLLRKKIVSVGDVSTKRLIDMGLEPEVAIVDGKTQRHKVVELGVFRSFLVVENPPGTVCLKSVETIKKAITEGHWIMVYGEEDLLALPALLLSPHGWVVIYGQPQAGVVYLEVNEYTKKHFMEIIRMSVGEGKDAILELLSA